MSKSMYEIIKRQNGEAFAKTIREFDNGIFEVPDLEKIVRHSGRNATPLLEYLESLKQIKIDEKEGVQNPFDLLEKAGYDVFYADTLKKQNEIFSYFEKDEMLCTFKDADRYQNYHILHCIKKNARQLKRADFKGREKREDEYGTSVISIQILKTGGFIKICNRYNHAVDYPDNTFYSDPDRIIKGLSAALKNHFNVDFSSKRHVFLPDGYLPVGDMILKYYKEVNNTYFGNGFYFKDGVLTLVDKNSQLQADDLIVDLKNKKILNPSGKHNALANILQHEMKGETLQVTNNKGVLSLCSSMGEILKVKDGCLKELSLYKTTRLPREFLCSHPHIEKVRGTEVTTCLQEVFCDCSMLKEVDFEKLTQIDFDFCADTRCVIKAPMLEKKGIKFFDSLAFDTEKQKFVTRGYFAEKTIDVFNRTIGIKKTALLEKEEKTFLLLDDKPFLVFKNNGLTEIYFDWHFDRFYANYVLTHLPDLEVFSSKTLTVLGENNLIDCPKLKRVSLENVTEFLGNNLSKCDQLEEVYAPNLLMIGRNTFSNNKNYKKAEFKKLYKAESPDCFSNSGYEEVSLPSLCYAGRNFCSNNPFLKKVSVHSLRNLGEYSFSFLPAIEELSLPELQYIEGRNIVQHNLNLKKVSFYKLMNMPSLCLDKCPLVQEVYLNNMYRLDGFSLGEKKNFKYIYAPKLKVIDDVFYRQLPKGFCLEAPVLELKQKKISCVQTCFLTGYSFQNQREA